MKQACLLWSLLVVLAVAVTALVLSLVFHVQDNQTTYRLSQTVRSLSADAASAQTLNSLQQAQLVEIMSTQANVTVIQEGTFTWAIGGYSQRGPAETCSDIVVTGFAIATAGLNYRVDDLVTVINGDLAFYETPVLQITSVGDNGEVLTFDMRTPGCLLATVVSNVTIETWSIVGSGLTIQRYDDIYPAITNAYYAYPTPPQSLVCPLQRSSYVLKQLTIASVTFMLLELNGPEFPMITTVPEHDALHVALHAFEPAIEQLPALGYFNYILPLTTKNYNAISLTDDTSCFITNVICWMDASDTDQRNHPGAMLFNIRSHGTAFEYSQPFIEFRFTSHNDEYDYVDNHAVFSLNYSLVLLIPSL